MSQEDVLYLSHAAELLPKESIYLLLKSHLLWQCMIKQGSILDKQSSFCPHCMQHWSHGQFSFSIQQAMSPGPRMARIIRKHDRAPKSLSNIESKLLRRHFQRRGNKVVFRCYICKNNTSVRVNKPLVQESDREELISESQELSTQLKRTKKKDRFVGLKISAVLSAGSSLNSKRSANRKSTESCKDLRALDAEKSEDFSSKQNQSARQSGLNQGVPQKDICTSSKQNLKMLGANDSHKSTYRDKMRLLHEKQRDKEREAINKSKLRDKRKDKLHGFLGSQDKNVGIEDRIKCLLEK